MPELELIIRHPLNDDDMRHWCRWLWDHDDLSALTDEHLSELRRALAVEADLVYMLGDLENSDAVIQHTSARERERENDND